MDGFGGSCIATMELFSGDGLWYNFWLGQFAIYGSSVYDCGFVLHGGPQVFVHVEVPNKCDAILRIFLIVGVGFLWY